jgi:hypothetical protein
LLPGNESQGSAVDATTGVSFPLNTDKYRLLQRTCGPLEEEDSSVTSLSQTRQIHKAIFDDGLPKQQQQPPFSATSKFGNVVEIARSSRHREPSWFPAVDDLVATRFASVGGPKGVLTSWVLTSSSQSLSVSTGGAGAIQSQSTVVTPPPKVFTFYKLRYQVGGNRWCRNVQRAHRSNGVVLEVDLTRKEVTQTCWDADCRRFRSHPEALFVDVPDGVVSWLGVPMDPDALHRLVLDRCVVDEAVKNESQQKLGDEV